MIAETKGECFNKKMNLVNMYDHWKCELIGWTFTTTIKKCHYLKCVNFEKKSPNVRTLFLNIMTTFDKFALITETSSTETVVNPILENRNIYVTATGLEPTAT